MKNFAILSDKNNDLIIYKDGFNSIEEAIREFKEKKLSNEDYFIEDLSDQLR